MLNVTAGTCWGWTFRWTLELLQFPPWFDCSLNFRNFSNSRIFFQNNSRLLFVLLWNKQKNNCECFMIAAGMLQCQFNEQRESLNATKKWMIYSEMNESEKKQSNLLNAHLTSFRSRSENERQEKEAPTKLFFHLCLTIIVSPLSLFSITS